jgi:hypothetical protein
VRLNGTSDIVWENEHPELFAMFCHSIQFYDYTKLVKRKHRFDNYHLTASYSEANAKYAASVLASPLNWAVVFDTKKGEPLPKRFHGRRVIDGDLYDLRFLDPEGVVVGLRAKGRAKHETNGFVIRTSEAVGCAHRPDKVAGARSHTEGCRRLRA